MSFIQNHLVLPEIKITLILEDTDEAEDIVTQFQDETVRAINFFVKDCKRRFTLSCRGMVGRWASNKWVLVN